LGFARMAVEMAADPGETWREHAEGPAASYWRDIKSAETPCLQSQGFGP